MDYRQIIAGYQRKKPGTPRGHAVEAIEDMPDELAPLADYFADMPADSLRASWVAGLLAALTESEDEIELCNLARCLIVVDIRLGEHRPPPTIKNRKKKEQTNAD